ncbi:NPCBM/NEW2 domain-containing protein [Cellvibrio sp. OA-2007]|uniref:NPCBM/NEW2 domain-containing protein n=1 Tax=Cellvibrio sp. OA-2007 TaxID=529823 RepID=UPI00187CD380|nr:NPCBM/NEW2 domain-containing protein [Cellvibrio sp. OA-2007]
MSSFNGTLTITGAVQHAFINEPVYLWASMSEGSDWKYQWRLIEDGNYQRRDAFGFIWDSSTISAECHPSFFGSRLSGKIYPPRSGLYRFLVAADTSHEFYLNKNGVNEKLTHSNNKVDKAGYFNVPQQQSEWIELQAGQAYPIEFFYIKSNSQGHYSLLWQQPGSSSWEEIPDTVYSKPDELTASGRLQRETINGSWNNLDQVREQLAQVNNPSENSYRFYQSANIGVAANSYARHTLEVTATSGNLIARKQISFVPRDRFVSEDNSGATNHWLKKSDGNAQLTLTTVDDGSAQGLVLQIETSSSARFAEWFTNIHLIPYKAYEVRARVRLLNPPNNLPMTSGMGDSRSWKLARLRVGVHGDASEQGIDPRDPTQWREVAVDFIVPFHGIVDIHAHMGEYTGKFQIDNLRLIELNDHTVTQFEFPNLSANIYNEVVERTGGYAATHQYFSRVAQAAADMRELSGKYAYAECQKENIFMPRNWSVFAMGTNYNGMILKTPDLLTTDFLKSVWASHNIVGGVMVHELEHSFDFPGSSFDAHLPVLLQAYAMDKRNLLRTADSNFVTVDQWMENERNRFRGCFSDPGALVPKLFEFQKLLPADQKWASFKQIMHDRWSPYKTEIEGRSWPTNWGSDYDQYRAWWRELKSYTGLDGWELLHTYSERQQIESMFQRRSLTFNFKDPSDMPTTKSELFLWEATRKSVSVGWGELDTNIVKIENTCNDKSIYAHAPSKITYQLNKKWKTFDTSAFIKDDSQWGLVAARIIGDGIELYRSTAFDARDGLQKLPSINVSNVDQLTLEFLDMGSTNSDWSVWVEPRLSR